MKTTLLALTLLAGCGRMFNDATDVAITVPVPAAAEFTIDGMPYGHADPEHKVYVDAHHDHHIVAVVGAEIIGACSVYTTIQTRYVIGDVALLELVFPIVLDALGNDWAVVEPTTCVFR